MAIDTHAKKLSIIDADNMFESGLPVPSGDAVISQGDRQHLIYGYSGVNWASLSITKGTIVCNWQWDYYDTD